MNAVQLYFIKQKPYPHFHKDKLFFTLGFRWHAEGKMSIRLLEPLLFNSEAL